MYSLRKTAGLLAALALVLGLAGCSNNDAENQKRVEGYFARVAELSGGVAPGFIEAKGETLTLRDIRETFTLSVPDGDIPIEMAIEEVVMEGVDFDAFDTPGARTVAKKISINNLGYSLRQQGEVSMTTSVAVKAYLLTDWKADLSLLLTALGQKDLESCLEAMRPIRAKDFSLKDYSADIRVDVINLQIQMDEASARDISIEGFRDYRDKNTRLRFMGLDVLTIASTEVGEMRLPDIIGLVLLASDQQKIEDDPEAFLEQVQADGKRALKERPLVINGFVMKDMRLTLPMLNETILLDSFGFDLHVAMDKIRVAAAMKDLEVPASLYGQADRKAQLLAQIYEKPLVVSGTFDMETEAAGDRGTLRVHALELSEKALGSFALNAIVDYLATLEEYPALPAEPEDMRLLSVNVKVVDSGAGDLSLALMEGRPLNPNEIRSFRDMAVMALNANLDANNPEKEKAQQAIIEFLKKAGILELTIKADPPVLFDELKERGDDIFGADSPVKFSVSHLPAN